MRETIVESVKVFISPKFIKVQHFKHHGKHYTKKGSAYIMHTFIFNETCTLQYNLSIGCSTIWLKYGLIIGNNVAMEMEKLYSYCSYIIALNAIF